MANKIDFKQRITEQQDALNRLENVKSTIENDEKLRSVLNEALSQMDSDLSHFRNAISNTMNEVYSDGIIDASEINKLDLVDDHIYTQVSKLGGYISSLEAAGVPVPSSLHSNYNFLYRKMLEAKANTAQARKDRGDHNSYKSLNLSYEGAHPVQNRTAQKRISIRATPEAQKLLKEMGLYKEINKESLATKRFRDVEYGRTA